MKDINDFIHNQTIKANNALVEAQQMIGENDYATGKAKGNLELITELKNFISSKNVLPAAKSFPLKQSECKHREQPRTWHKEYSTWRCDGCGKWYE